MNLIENNFKNFLPLNRKERFFTGTVLPQIICENNFKYIDKFFSLIPNFPKKVKIDTSASKNNIQFLTEYSIKESYNDSEGYIKYNNLPLTKDTPDMVVLITSPEVMLIVIEAKMYGAADVTSLNNQMRNQERNVIVPISATLDIKKENVFHLALLPKKMIDSYEYFEYTKIFWEDIVDAYASLMKKNYFFNILTFALDNYERLVSQKTYYSYSKAPDTKLTGAQIEDMFNKGKNFLVGRTKGFLGDFLRNDKLTGNWKTFLYEVNFATEVVPNSNWFTAKQFISFMVGSNTPVKEPDEAPAPYVFGAIKSIGSNGLNKGPEVVYRRDDMEDEDDDIFNRDPNIEIPRLHTPSVAAKTIETVELDPWHFSHLGKDFFLDIAGVTCKIRSFNVDLKEVYIGASGEPYVKKTQGGRINPNWYVVTKDGDEYRGGPRVKGLVEPGSWKKASCKGFDWEDIKEFFIKKNNSNNGNNFNNYNSWNGGR